RGMRRLARSRKSSMLRIMLRLAGDGAKMLDHRRRFEERADMRTPKGKRGRPAKSHRMVFESRPFDAQRIAVRGLHRAAQLMRQIALAGGEHGEGLGESRLERRFAAGPDAEQGDFDDHGWPARLWPK